MCNAFERSTANVKLQKETIRYINNAMVIINVEISVQILDLQSDKGLLIRNEHKKTTYFSA